MGKTNKTKNKNTLDAQIDNSKFLTEADHFKIGGSEIRTQKTVQKKLVFLKAFEATLGNVSAACRESGISRQEYYRWTSTDAYFVTLRDDIMEQTIDFAESCLLKQIRDGSSVATMFFLKTKGRGRGYVEKMVNIVEVQGLDAMSNDDLDRIINGGSPNSKETNGVPNGELLTEDSILNDLDSN